MGKGKASPQEGIKSLDREDVTVNPRHDFISFVMSPTGASLLRPLSTSNGESRMEKNDTHQLLSIRLGAIHSLMTEMLEAFLAWITDGAAKRFALEHKSEQVMFSDMEPFYQLLGACRATG